MRTGLVTVEKPNAMFEQACRPDSCYTALFEQAPWPVFILSQDGSVVAWNRKAARLMLPDHYTGQPEPVARLLPLDEESDHEQVVPILFRDWFINEEQDMVRAWIGRIFREHKAQTLEAKLLRGNDTMSVRLIGLVIDGYEDLAQVTLQDFSGEQQNNGQALVQMAYYDQLTGLPNRFLLTDRMRWAIRDASRQNEKMAVLAIDLDHFKRINDSFGHQAGDRLLQEISQRMLSCLRDSDTLARLGGDEFVVFMQHVTDSQDVVLVAERLLKVISRPLDIMGVDQEISASIGICFYPEDGNRVQELMEKADIALYRSKNSGRNLFAFFNEDMKEAADERVDFEKRLRKACENKELTLYYQPIIASDSRSVIALEALLRWDSQKSGLLTAASFLPVAETIGVDRQFADWAMLSAFRQMKSWLDQGLIDPADPCRLTVNLSDLQLTAPDLVEQVGRLLEESGLPANRLVLEVRESALYQDSLQVRKNMEGLHDMAIQLYLDDFCHGFCTLNETGQFPFTSLKIDQRITATFADSQQGEMLLATMIRLAHLFSLRVIAEGVESRDVEDCLVRHGCDALQGYWISRPLPPVQTELLLSLTRFK